MRLLTATPSGPDSPASCARNQPIPQQPTAASKQEHPHTIINSNKYTNLPYQSILRIVSSQVRYFRHYQIAPVQVDSAPKHNHKKSCGSRAGPDASVLRRRPSRRHQIGFWHLASRRRIESVLAPSAQKQRTGF